MARLLCAAALVLLAGCGGCGESALTRTRQAPDQLCPSAVNPGASPGAECFDSLECQEYCCDCPGGIKGFGASGCLEAVCGDRVTTCEAALKKQPELCP